MRFHVYVKNFRFYTTDRHFTERCMLFALGRFENRISRVTVSLAGLNGPRGGIDKQCRVAVKLPCAREITVEETQSNVLAAIAGAADRAGRAVSRVLRRWQDARHDRRAKHSPRSFQYLPQEPSQDQ